MKCDNDSSKGGHPIISPQCVFQDAAQVVTVRYSDVEMDALHLCDKCAEALKKDAHRHHYSVSSRKIE